MVKVSSRITMIRCWWMTTVFLSLLLFLPFCWASRGLNYGHYASVQKPLPSSTGSSAGQKCIEFIVHKNFPEWMEHVQDRIDRLIDDTKKCLSKPPPLFVLRSIYWLTAADAVQCVLMNSYSSHFVFATTKKPTGARPSVMFLFARVRPRLFFAVGSLLRALQLCTPLRLVFDPSVGVGAGINISAMIAGSRWVKPLILGWATTRWAWTWLGARQPDRVHVPIVLSIRDAHSREYRGSH